MKQKGRAITGDDIKVSSYTNDWVHVRVHPIVFYRRYETFAKGFKSVKGLYAELDLGQFVSIRFSDKNDLTAFHRLHHEYI
jgi:hypothetical protein